MPDQGEPLLQGFSLIGRANYHSPSHVVAPEIFARHYELIFVDKGCLVHCLNGRHYVLKSGDCFLICPMQQHSTAQQAEERGRFYWWIFDPRDGLLGLDAQRSALLLTALRQSFCAPNGTMSALRHLPAKSAAQLRNALAALFRNWGGWGDPALRTALPGRVPVWQLLAWEHSLLGLFHTVLHGWQQHPDGANDAPDSAPPPSPAPVSGGSDREAAVSQQSRHYLQKICIHIAANIRHNISFAELRRLTPYSEPHLLRLFRNEYGLPLRDYINREKIQKAKELIRKGMPITQVATELSFSSSQYFTVVFRRYAGTSPSIWRKDDLR